MEESAAETTLPPSEQAPRKPLWSRPCFQILPLEQTLNNSTRVNDSTSDQHS